MAETQYSTKSGCQEKKDGETYPCKSFSKDSSVDFDISDFRCIHCTMGLHRYNVHSNAQYIKSYICKVQLYRELI